MSLNVDINKEIEREMMSPAGAAGQQGIIRLLSSELKARDAKARNQLNAMMSPASDPNTIINQNERETENNVRQEITNKMQSMAVRENQKKARMNQALAGIAARGATNMNRMANGGIVGYSSGELVQEQPSALQKVRQGVGQGMMDMGSNMQESDQIIRSKIPFIKQMLDKGPAITPQERAELKAEVEQNPGLIGMFGKQLEKLGIYVKGMAGGGIVSFATGDKVEDSSFPDLNKDGKVTYADVIKGRIDKKEGGIIGYAGPEGSLVGGASMYLPAQAQAARDLDAGLAELAKIGVDATTAVAQYSEDAIRALGKEIKDFEGSGSVERGIISGAERLTNQMGRVGEAVSDSFSLDPIRQALRDSDTNLGDRPTRDGLARIAKDMLRGGGGENPRSGRISSTDPNPSAPRSLMDQSQQRAQGIANKPLTATEQLLAAERDAILRRTADARQLYDRNDTTPTTMPPPALDDGRPSPTGFGPYYAAKQKERQAARDDEIRAEARRQVEANKIMFGTSSDELIGDTTDYLTRPLTQEQADAMNQAARRNAGRNAGVSAEARNKASGIMAAGLSDGSSSQTPSRNLLADGANNVSQFVQGAGRNFNPYFISGVPSISELITDLPEDAGGAYKAGVRTTDILSAFPDLLTGFLNPTEESGDLTLSDVATGIGQFGRGLFGMDPSPTEEEEVTATEIIETAPSIQKETIDEATQLAADREKQQNEINRRKGEELAPSLDQSSALAREVESSERAGALSAEGARRGASYLTTRGGETSSVELANTIANDPSTENMSRFESEISRLMDRRESPVRALSSFLTAFSQARGGSTGANLAIASTAMRATDDALDKQIIELEKLRRADQISERDFGLKQEQFTAQKGLVEAQASYYANYRDMQVEIAELREEGSIAEANRKLYESVLEVAAANEVRYIMAAKAELGIDDIFSSEVTKRADELKKKAVETQYRDAQRFFNLPETSGLDDATRKSLEAFVAS